MSDLLDQLGKKNNQTAEGAGATSDRQTSASSTSNGSEMGRGEDLLTKAGKQKQADTSAARSSEAFSADKGTNPNSASSTEEPARSNDSTNSGWTEESTLKEVKKLREENKAYRIKYQEQLEQVRLESEARIKAKEAEMESLRLAQAELDRIKADQEDKKRDLSEKVAHREARLAEMQAMIQAKDKEYNQKISAYETQLADYKAQQAAEAQVYKTRLDEEISKIPDKYKDYATLLVKGAGDPREALVAITEAKLKGMFEDKTVIVNHSVPNAYDGARSSSERLQEAEKARRSSMNSSQKIGEALKQIKSGNPNSVFRINK